MINRVYLIGFMGSGKSTLGRWLADAMDWSFLDLDLFIENKYHKTIPQIFEEKGESAFREMENICLEEVSSFENVIIGAGGGTPCYYNNMDIMNQTGLAIYLKLTPEVIYNRLMTSKAKRPLIEGKHGEELLSFIAEKLSEREDYYMKANMIADAENWEVDNYVDSIKKAK